MIATWLAAILLLYVSPISYVHAPGFAAWMIILGGIALFCLGAMLGAMSRDPAAAPIEGPSMDNLAIVCAALGFLGIIAVTVDKLYLSDIDWSIGIAQVRERRAIEVMKDVAIRRSWLLYFGYMTFSFSCVAIAIFMLVGERLQRLASALGQLSILPMAIYAVLYGGRMPILLVILLILGAGATRAVLGKTLVPSGHWLWWKFAILGIAFLIYTNQVWQTRREIDHLTGYTDFFSRAEKKWELRPAAWLDRAIRDGVIPVGPAMDWLSIDLYLTHAPTTVQRMVEHWREFSVYGGLYQIGILSPISDVFAPSLKLPQKMRTELNAIGAYGWYPSAWGAWLGDAGLIGGAVCVFIWGLLSGFCYRQAVKRASLAATSMLPFVYMAIFVSPLNGPLGAANSFQVFLSFAVVCAWLAWRDRPAKPADDR